MNPQAATDAPYRHVRAGASRTVGAFVAVQTTM
jgi:hypothetical protein